MGIKDLFKTIKSVDDSLVAATDFAQLCDKLIAVDASCYIHKYAHARPEGREWVIAFSNLVLALRRANVHPFFVFDGSTPTAKKSEVDKRRVEREQTEDRLINLRADLQEFEENGYITENLRDENRSAISTDKIDVEKLREVIHKLYQRCRKVDSTDLSVCKKLLDVCTIPWFQSPDGIESEWICAEMCRNGSVSAVLSEDSDLIAHRCPNLISNPKSEGGPIWSCTSIEYPAVREAFGLTDDQFLDYCVLCGTDYNARIPRVGPQTAMKLLNKHGSIEVIASETQYDTEILNTNVTRSVFMGTVDVPSPRYSDTPDKEIFKRFCSRYHISYTDENFDKAFRRALRILNDDGASEVVSPKADRILKPPQRPGLHPATEPRSR